MKLIAPALLLALVACGKDAATSTDDAPPDADQGGEQPGFTRLIGRTWDIPAGANIYKCARVTVPQDMYITAIDVQQPAGAHHTLLTIAGANGTAGPDGEHDCGATNIGMYMLYAASVGTPELALPTGVGVKVSAGQQLHLNLHLLNTTDETQSGESVILVKTQPEPPAMLAEMVLAGPLELDIQPTNQPLSFSGDCTATEPYTLFAVWPHMHRFATHQKVELVHGATTSVLHDKAFKFDEQGYYPVAPMAAVATGDRVRVTCTYVNGTTSTVTYGDGPDKEMCFAGLYRFPAVGSNEYCPN
ncbi:MAG TPA: hypothetical protein VIV40_39835 [Kofleriaceae bacterium]